MKLKGTIEERIQQAIEFGRAHRSAEYDEKYPIEIYRKAGAPFTDVARKLWRDFRHLMQRL